MGFLDDATKMAGKALDALGAGAQSASDSKEKPERGVSLLNSSNSPRGKYANDIENSAPNPMPTDPIEFIHYSFVHADDGNAFRHPEYQPPANGLGQPPPDGRAMMFRDALERESLMLHAYLNSCKIVLSEYLRNRGPLGDAAQVAGSLLGGGPSSPKPDPAQLDALADKVQGAAKKVNLGAIKYEDVHRAGADLHQARANFKQFAQSLKDHYLKPGGGGTSPLGVLDKAVGSLPGPAKALMAVQKIGFSMFDIYLGVFIELQRSTQRQIELASHRMTLDAITTNYEGHALTFPVWSPLDPAAVVEETTTREGGEEKKGGAGFSKEVDFLKPVKDQAKKIGDKVDRVKEDVYDFAGVNSEPRETPGSAELTKIFGVLKGGETGKDAGSATEMIVKALNASLESVGGLPSFLHAPIREITNANMGLLEEVYRRIMAQSPAALAKNKIEIDMLEAAGRRHLEKMLSGFLVGLLASLIPTKAGGGSDVVFGGISAQQMATKQLEERLGKNAPGRIIDKVLDIAIGQLADNLDQVRAKAAKEKCLTMEVFLGRLPWLTALMFRNTFFVMWNELVKVAFGPAAGFLDKATGAVAPGVEKAKDALDTAEEAKRRAEKLNEVKDEGVSVGPKGSNLDKYENAVEDETEGGKARAEERAGQRERAAQLDAFKLGADPLEKFPISGRVAAGQGETVTDEVPSILPEAA